jgi:hypothetical protein
MPDISDPQDLSRFSSMPDWLRALYGAIGHNRVDMGGDMPLDRGITSPPPLQEGRSVSTSSGYLPDWIQAALGQGGMPANAPTGLFSETAASPSPAVGLLASTPPDPRGFMALAPASTDNTNPPATPSPPTDLRPPVSPPNSTVIGTAASGAPEVTAQKSPGFGDYLNTAANAIGSIYGAGGPGDALIALGLSNRTNGASIQALNAGILNRSKQAELALKQAEANDKIRAIAGNVSLVKKLYPNMGDEEASAFARNSEMMKQIGQVAAPMEQWSAPYTDEQGNTAMRHLRTGETKILQSANETFHPATAAEKAAAGINPNDPTPYQTSDRTQKIAPIGGPATAVTVNNAPALSYGGELLAPVVEEHKKLVAGLPQSQERLRNLNAMSGALQAIREKGGTTGMGEEEKVRLQSLVNTAANTVGMQPFDISNQELMNKFGRLMAANAAKDAQGARVTNFELDNFLKANPGLSLSPQGNERLLGIMQQIEERNINVSKELRKRATSKNPPSVQENDQRVQQYDEEHHIKDPITGQDITADPKLPSGGGSSGGTSSGVRVPSFRIIGQ